ncbi:MAG: prepilin-type N-terminal cleavage/methylation domain-containing protein [Planctomycetota bacterium]|nr:MAG: prepilin-type N-terminal cleavage/methylation domain-containing protein [Planctomycetota bacterium]
MTDKVLIFEAAGDGGGRFVKGITVKCKKTGFTIVELMTAVAIIAMLIAILIPALAMVRKVAKETQQKAQFATIGLALTAFKGDYGDYPPSDIRLYRMGFYSGAQKLAEAMVGQDLLGFHKDSIFRSDLRVDLPGESGYELYPDDLDPTREDGRENLDARMGPYLELKTARAFRLGDTSEHDGLFDATRLLDEDTYVLCDVFGVKKVTLAEGETAKAGTPILYYRANTSSKTMTTGQPEERIYSGLDNMELIALGKLPEPDPDDQHKLYEERDLFYSEDYGIIDQRVEISTRWPHRPDSYILISAGADGEYGTSDDIFNF